MHAIKKKNYLNIIIFEKAIIKKELKINVKNFKNNDHNLSNI